MGDVSRDRRSWSAVGLGRTTSSMTIRAVAATIFPLVAGEASTTFARGEATQPNVLVLVADDMGVDTLDMYEEGSDPARTPNLAALAASGLMFRNAYANPVCSPTRALLMTGRYGFRTGVQYLTPPFVYGHSPLFGQLAGLRLYNGFRPYEVSLRQSEFMLGEALAAGAPGTPRAYFGKGHLWNGSNGGLRGPNRAGWPLYAGALNPIEKRHTDWFKVTNGQVAFTHQYADSNLVDDAVAWIAQHSSPWFLLLMLNLPHGMMHAPPDPLHNYSLTTGQGKLCPPSERKECYRAMIEAMDTEIGRLLSTVPANTEIIFVADNGTPGFVTKPPFNPQHGKATLYEGGVNVPLIVSGPSVANPGTETQALVNVVDLWPTALELAGVDVGAVLPAGTTIDGLSLVPILDGSATELARGYQFAEMFHHDGQDPSDGYAIRNAQYKLIVRPSGLEELYDLAADPFEAVDLLPSLTPTEQAAYDALSSQLAALLGS